MTNKMPPIPPENVSPKGPGDTARKANDGTHVGNPQKQNTDKIGQPGNSKVKTWHDDLQQDR